jgi:putative flavoprotein involved in K+ transport
MPHKPASGRGYDARVGERVGALVVGAGACGLAAAAVLKRAGRPAVVLEREQEIGTSWARRYDTLRLNTMGAMSHLPGYRFPRRYGRYPSRDDVVEYLRDYARREEIDIRFGVAVERIDRADGGWTVATSDGGYESPLVVVATGYDVAARMPAWPGADTFEGELLHAREFRSAGEFAGRTALVVGAGNSGTEIAHHLLAAGAREVKVSMRTPPNIFPRDFLGLSLNPPAIAVELLPSPIGDRVLFALQRVVYGDLSRYGMPRSPYGALTRVRDPDVGAAPAVDDGFVADLKRGDVELVPVIERFEGRDVVLTGGRRLQPEVVIAATGYERGLEPLVGHLDVLEPDGHPVAPDGRAIPHAPGLFFVGYVPAISGQLRQARIQARRLAREVRRRPPAEAARRPAGEVTGRPA